MPIPRSSRLLSAGTLALCAASLGVLLGGCGIGMGSGHISGDLTLLGCRENQDRVGLFDLGASFFAGEPFDDPSPSKTHNQLVLRVQRTSARPENADVVSFHITSTYEVARCVAGAVKADGSPDWDPQVCDRSNGTPRVLIGDGGQVIHVTFNPFLSCPNAGVLDAYSALLSGTALGDCDGSDPGAIATNPVGCPAVCPAHDSWIEFAAFGGVSENGGNTVGTKFVVNYGDQIKAANLHLGLCDASTVNAFRERLFVPLPRLMGTLDGWFDFDLRRGQGAQAFP